MRISTSNAVHGWSGVVGPLEAFAGPSIQLLTRSASASCIQRLCTARGSKSATAAFTAQLARDRYDCVRDALQGTSIAVGSPLMVLGAEIDNQNRQNMVLRLCMEARGYREIK